MNNFCSVSDTVMVLFVSRQAKMGARTPFYDGTNVYNVPPNSLISVFSGINTRWDCCFFIVNLIFKLLSQSARSVQTVPTAALQLNWALFIYHYKYLNIR